MDKETHGVPSVSILQSLLQLCIECDAYNAVNNYSVWMTVVLAGKWRAQAHTPPITQTRTAFRKKEKLLLWHSLETSGFIRHFLNQLSHFCCSQIYMDRAKLLK